MAELEPLPVDDIKARLRDDTRYSVGELRAAAAVAGIPSHRKLGREALAHQIAMKIANLRGYQRLGGGHDEQSTVLSESHESEGEGHDEKTP